MIRSSPVMRHEIVTFATLPSLPAGRTNEWLLSQGTTDFPASIFAEDLVKAYPEALIILNTRSEEALFDSMTSTLYDIYLKHWSKSTPEEKPNLSTKIHTFCWANDFPANGRRYFSEHNERVRELAPGRARSQILGVRDQGRLGPFVPVPRSAYS